MIQELKFDTQSSTHSLDLLSKSIDIGKYKFAFEVISSEAFALAVWNFSCSFHRSWMTSHVSVGVAS